MRCEWKSLFPVPAHKAARGGLALRGGGSLVEVAGDGKSRLDLLLPGVQGSLLSADVQGGPEPPSKRDQLT